jgi:hypothetical protein
MLDFPVGNLYLATGLGMIRSGDLMSNGVLEKQGLQKPVAKVFASVTDDGPGSTKSAEEYPTRPTKTAISRVVELQLG